METSATTTTETTKENVLEAIIACAKMLDSCDARRRDFYLPMPEWINELCTKNEADNAALAAFKKNSSYWPEQFPWCRKRYLGRVFMRPRPYYREYRPVFST